MKVTLRKDAKGLMVAPETDFETEFLERMFPDGGKTWIKTGTTPAETVGLVIEPVKKVEEKT